MSEGKHVMQLNLLAIGYGWMPVRLAANFAALFTIFFTKTTTSTNEYLIQKEYYNRWVRCIVRPALLSGK
ncbi:hypothetical protein GCM10027577_12650 [Spirosoma fluminis]